MGLPTYRDVEGNLHEKADTSVHHVFARSLTKGSTGKRFINQYPLTPRMLNVYHYSGKPEGLHENVGLLRPPEGFVLHCMNRVIADLDSVGQYNQIIEFADRVEDLSLHSGSGEMRKECGRIAENLQLQLPYILRGQVEYEDSTRQLGI